MYRDGKPITDGQGLGMEEGGGGCKCKRTVCERPLWMGYFDCEGGYTSLLT